MSGRSVSARVWDSGNALVMAVDNLRRLCMGATFTSHFVGTSVLPLSRFVRAVSRKTPRLATGHARRVAGLCFRGSPRERVPPVKAAAHREERPGSRLERTNREGGTSKGDTNMANGKNMKQLVAASSAVKGTTRRPSGRASAWRSKTVTAAGIFGSTSCRRGRPTRPSSCGTSRRIRRRVRSSAGAGGGAGLLRPPLWQRSAAASREPVRTHRNGPRI